MRFDSGIIRWAGNQSGESMNVAHSRTIVPSGQVTSASMRCRPTGQLLVSAVNRKWCGMTSSSSLLTALYSGIDCQAPSSIRARARSVRCVVAVQYKVRFRTGTHRLVKAMEFCLAVHVRLATAVKAM